MKCCESAGCAEDVSTVTAVGDRLRMGNARQRRRRRRAFVHLHSCDVENCDENASVRVCVLVISTAPLVFPVNVRRRFHLETDRL